MWPQQFRLRDACRSLALSLISSTGLIADRALSADPASSNDSTAARAVTTSFARRAPLVTFFAAEEKKRVPKPPDDTRHKPAKETPASTSDTSDEDEGFVAGCIGDCLTGFFSSLFTSAAPPPPPQPVSALRAEALAWVVGDRAWIRATQRLWDRPGGEAEGGAEAGSLPHGAPVAIVETFSSSAGMWLRVRPLDGVEPVGWIPASAASMEPVPSPTDSLPPASPRAARRPPTWGIHVAFGGGFVGPSELNVEYQEATFRAEAQYLRFLPKQWQSSAGLGWRYAEGSPQVIYRTPTIIEEPSNSRLWMLDIGVRGGQRYADRSGFRFDWLLGPSLYYVHERADVKTFDASTLALIGTSVESLGRWAGGGDLRLGFGRMLDPGEFSLVFSGYLMAWTGHQQRPLSSDFVHSSIHGFEVLLAFTIPAP